MRLTPVLFIVAIFTFGPAAADTVEAVWEPQTAEFNYLGVTTYYTCDGIKTKAEKLMRELGAREVTADIRPCFHNGQVQSMYKVKLDYTALSRPSDKSKTPVVEAVEENVVIDSRFLGSYNDNDCELVERFVKYALPETGFEAVSGEVGCNANRSRLSGELRVKTLRPADESAAP